MFAVMTLRTHYLTTAIIASSLTLTAATPPEISPEADALFAQPLAPFEDACNDADGIAVRHLRFATLDGSGSNEDRLELRMTVAPDGLRLDYLVNDGVAFTQTPDGQSRVTPLGQRLLMDEHRGAKVLAAFAAAHARTFATDVGAPQHACGTMRGKAEQQLKCGGIALFGCASGNPVACFIAGGASVLCMYAIEKACEQEPDSCQPGWTEG